MEKVKIDKQKLLSALNKNRAADRAIFEEAQGGYRDKAIKLLDKALKDAREGRSINTFIQLQAPIDQTKDYDRAIRMIEMSVDDTIVISERDFANYILDQWDWQHNFNASTAMYLKKGI